MVFEEVFGGCGICFVERVEEGGVEGAEGQFVDYVGEVERCNIVPIISMPTPFYAKQDQRNKRKREIRDIPP